MNEITIAVKYDNDNPTVSGRELHDVLGVQTAYKDWFPRMCGYGFVEGRDFNPLKIERVQNEGFRSVSREVTDHQLTIDMAKELCINVYTPNEDIKNIIAEIGNNDYSVAPKAVYSISISEDDLAALSELNGINNLSDELKDVLSRKTLGAVITQINGMSGVDNLAAASLCTVGKTFVNENVTEDTIYLYTYENALPVAVTFAVGDDFSVSANGVFVMYEDFTCSSAAEIENFFSEIAVEAKEVAPEK